ncbi:toxin-antitoxin system YwqK family antitoxin [Flavobacterium sp. UBA7663]|uniref:toxin-antitoxin system YwqK family antitoxin n=1 Tax=Flavobacterium sp. UBA7663 TaxID=1946557 RepID=UPI0025BF56B8|nr:hypothetical protein [Flavobacterium sp. UBA7663]
MRLPLYMLTFLFFVSCRTSRTEVEYLNKTEISEYYDNGEIKSIGAIDYFHKEFNNFRVGFWREFYKNGNLKSEGNYKLDTYKQCCTGGICNGYYSYKYGEWKYYHENGNLKTKGTYRMGKKHKKTSCEGGDEINFGYITNSWIFYDINENEIKPSQEDILEIENSSYLDEFQMSKY